MRSAPQSRLFAAISLIKLIVSSESLGLLDRAFDLRIQNRWKSSRWKPKKRLGLNEEERLFPGPRHSGQEHQKQPIRLFVYRSLDVSTQDDELLPRASRFPPAVRLCLWSDRRTFRAQRRSSVV
jgi:hypothetical protein